MNTDWKAFFDTQRKILHNATKARDTDAFAAACQEFASAGVILGARWDFSKRDFGTWRTLFEWSVAGEFPANGAGRREQIEDFEHDGRESRVVLYLSDSEICPSHGHAICASLRMAVELHDEWRMQQADDKNGADVLGHASLDAVGNVLRADVRFDQLMRTADPDWDVYTMPIPVEPTDAVLRFGLTWRGLFFYVDQDDAQIHLRARPDHALPDLTGKEIDVARLVASELTFKEIAQKLDMAPSTASTHLYKVYDKLQINRRSALVQWLSQHEHNLIQ